MSTDDYYAILGVRRDATYEQIRAGYKELARHRLVGDELDGKSFDEWLKSLRTAWDTLSDPVRKAEYDAALQASSKNGQMHESPDSPEQLKRRIAELERELARVRRQRDEYYDSMYELAGSLFPADQAEDLLGQPEGTPIIEIIEEYECNRKE